MKVKELLKDVFELFYPNNCALCSISLNKGEEHICIACLMALPQTNFHNLKNNPVEKMLLGRFSFEKASSCYYFNKAGGMQDAMHSIKYLGNIYLAEYLGKGMANHLGEWLQDIDIIVPIPLSKKKETIRGYNQAFHIAKGISSVSQIELNASLIQRIKNTATQTKMTRTERIENMKDAFVWGDVLAWSGKHILIIDDVITTGSTMESCALAMPNIDIKISILSLAVAIES